jgi:hypothetical protein
LALSKVMTAVHHRMWFAQAAKPPPGVRSTDVRRLWIGGAARALVGDPLGQHDRHLGCARPAPQRGQVIKAVGRAAADHGMRGRSDHARQLANQFRDRPLIEVS